MLKNNAFDRPPFSVGIPEETSSFEADKYINDFRLLDIRCGVLEEEK